MNTKLSIKILSFSLILFCAACNEYGNSWNDPYREPYYNDPYRDPYRSDYYRNQHERRELDRERDRVERERRDLERERERQNNSYRPPVYTQPQQPRVETCPSGFSPSENKCSAEERRRGCKDMRLPGGLGCVHR